MKSPTDGTLGFQGCVIQVENPTFRCWVLVAKLEIFNSNQHLKVWCSKTQLWLSLVSTAGCGCARNLRSMSTWNYMAGCSVSPRPLETQSRRPNSAVRTGRVEGAREEKGGSEATGFSAYSLLHIPHPQPGVAPAPPGRSWWPPGCGLHQTLRGGRFMVTLLSTYGEQPPPPLWLWHTAAATQELTQSLPHSL